MGNNCLKINNSDDISLLRGSENIGTQDSPPTDPFAAAAAAAAVGGGGGEMQGAAGGSIFQHEPLQQPIFYPTSSISRPAAHLTEEEQVKIAKRIGLIQHLPIGAYDGSASKARECVICMVEFSKNEAVRYLPCMHIYHVHCIDDWLMRSLTCPSCLEPVDAALLISYETT